LENSSVKDLACHMSLAVVDYPTVAWEEFNDVASAEGGRNADLTTDPDES
jgi:hypothetical protein